MPYKVISDSAIDILKSYGEVKDPYTGESVSQDHGSAVYLPGDVIPDEDVSPVVKQAYEDGDKYTLSLLQKVAEKRKTENKPADKPLRGSKTLKDSDEKE